MYILMKKLTEGETPPKNRNEVDGEYLEMGNKTVAFQAINALPTPSPTARVDFEAYRGASLSLMMNVMPLPFYFLLLPFKRLPILSMASRLVCWNV